MTQRNENLKRLTSNYLFPEVNRRKRLFLEQHPNASLINLGVGDTTQPIPPSITASLAASAQRLGTPSGYTGYGPELGMEELRIQIASKLYHHAVSADDIFISDGAKCDIGRLQQLFGNKTTIAVQDPAYPVYIDGSIIQGVQQIIYLACTPENHFWPNWNLYPRAD